MENILLILETACQFHALWAELFITSDSCDGCGQRDFGTRIQNFVQSNQNRRTDFEFFGLLCFISVLSVLLYDCTAYVLIV